MGRAGNPRVDLSAHCLTRRRPLVSWKKMSDLLKSDLGPLSTSEFAALMALRVRAGEKGYCWPTQKTIAREARLSERKVRDCIRTLERLGWISIGERKENRRSNVYHIAPCLLSPSEEEGAADIAKPNTGTSRQKSGTACPRTAAPHAARKNKGKKEESYGSSRGFEPRPSRSAEVQYCDPVEFRQLISGLGKGSA